VVVVADQQAVVALAVIELLLVLQAVAVLRKVNSP
jgi:hypothetical protein